MSAQRFRKRPVEIEAMSWPADVPSQIEVTRWIERGGGETWVPFSGTYLLIRTLEGDMRAEVGDVIIRGVQGEFYPCKPDIFAATYEAVE